MDFVGVKTIKGKKVDKTRFKDSTAAVKGMIKQDNPVFQTGKKPCKGCSR